MILKIFELQAQTNEAQDQVELAMLQYILPRLSGMWQHLDRERGGTILELKNSVQKFFEKNFVHQKKYIKYFDADLIAFIYKNSTIKDIQYKPKGIRFEYSLSKKNAQKFISLERSQ